jgi:hypothetical protein
MADVAQLCTPQNSFFPFVWFVCFVGQKIEVPRFAKASPGRPGSAFRVPGFRKTESAPIRYTRGDAEKPSNPRGATAAATLP